MHNPTSVSSQVKEAAQITEPNPGRWIASKTRIEPRQRLSQLVGVNDWESDLPVAVLVAALGCFFLQNPIFRVFPVSATGDDFLIAFNFSRPTVNR